MNEFRFSLLKAFWRWQSGQVEITTADGKPLEWSYRYAPFELALAELYPVLVDSIRELARGQIADFELLTEGKMIEELPGALPLGYEDFSFRRVDGTVVSVQALKKPSELTRVQPWRIPADAYLISERGRSGYDVIREPQTYRIEIGDPKKVFDDVQIKWFVRLMSVGRNSLDEQGGTEPASASRGQGFWSCPDLAQKHKVDVEALSARLRRWREKPENVHGGKWIENFDRARGEPKFLYRESVVQHIIADLRKSVSSA